MQLKGVPEYRLWLMNSLAPRWIRWTFVGIFALGAIVLLCALLFLALMGKGIRLSYAHAASGLGAIALLGIWFELFLHTAPLVRRKINQPAEAFDRQTFSIVASARPQTCNTLSLALLRSPYFQFFAEKLDIDPEVLSPSFDAAGDETCFERVITSALNNAIERSESHVRVGDILYGLVEQVPVWKQFFDSRKITLEDIGHILAWRDMRSKDERMAKRIWEPISFLRVRPLGVNWTSGYTVKLDHFSYDLAIKAGHETWWHAIAHHKAIERMESALASNNTTNVLLVGPVGVGKRAAIEALARQVYQGQALGPLNYKRVLELDMEAVLSGVTHAGEVRGRLIQILNEAVWAGNVVLVIDNLHEYIGHMNIIGGADLSEILIPYLQSPRFQLIATTTEHDFQKAIEANPQLTNLFVKVDVSEPSGAETILILEDLAWYLEQRSKIRVDYSSLKEIVRLTDQYMLAQKQPVKSVKVLQDLFSSVGATDASGGRVLMAKDVQQFLSQRFGFQVGLAKAEEGHRLLHLEEELHTRVVAQDTAITLIADALRRARAGVHDRHRPIGSFLFLGPTGVGKTSVAKALAATYFGKEEAMIRFDMSEYQDKSSLAMLIGSGTLEQGGRLTEAVKASPFALILLDEIEKADHDVLNVFLQVLDEGTVRDGFGDSISFANTIIIATSNAGSEFIREHLGEYDARTLQTKLLDEIQKQNIFRPEFLNRFDAVVPFHPLNKEHLRQIARMMLDEFAERIKGELNVSLAYDDSVVAFLVEHGFQAEFGARPMRRIIQDTVEAVLAEALLNEAVKSGGTFTLNVQDLERKIK